MVDQVALLNEKSESLPSEDLTVKIGRRDVRATGFFDHTKATERYVILVIGDGASSREWYLPSYYRRTNVRIDTVAEWVDYVQSRVPLLSSEHISAYKDALRKQQLSLFGKKSNVTLPIFRERLENYGEWVWNKRFTSSNPQRRIQDIKEMGFTLATKMENKKTFHRLLPVERVTAPTYERMTRSGLPRPKARAFGFDCGRWFCRDAARDRQTEEDAPSGDRQLRTFVLRRREMDEAWNLVRVTRRGVADVGESVVVEGLRPGVVMEIR